jgi:flagellar protein FliJ
MLLEATQASAAATATSRNLVTGPGTSGVDLIAAQAYIERAERERREAALDLDRQDAEVAARRTQLRERARERQVMDKLEERQRADHNATWARRAQGALDEIALTMHRRNGQAAA